MLEIDGTERRLQTLHDADQLVGIDGHPGLLEFRCVVADVVDDREPDFVRILPEHGAHHLAHAVRDHLATIVSASAIPLRKR